MYFRGQLLNHFKQLRSALKHVGAEAALDIHGFALDVRYQGRRFLFHPQFVYLDDRERRCYSSRFRDSAFRFAGWSPYFSKRWELAVDKLKLKKYAVENRLLTPAYWPDPEVEVEDVVVKRSRPGKGAAIRGPFRSSREARLNLQHGEYYERFVSGKIAKIWFWNGTPVCCELSESGSVCGDGKRSIRDLIVRKCRQRDRKADVQSYRDFLAYRGRSLKFVPPPGEVEPVDFRQGSKLLDQGDIQDIDLRTHSILGVEEQLKQIGFCLLQAIPESIRLNTVFTVDAVLEPPRRLWILRMDSSPFLHPYVYAPMIESWAGDPEHDLRNLVYGAQAEALESHGKGLH